MERSDGEVVSGRKKVGSILEDGTCGRKLNDKGKDEWKGNERVLKYGRM